MAEIWYLVTSFIYVPHILGSVFMGPKTLPTIWGTYMKLVTKYQISAINSGWEKCDEKLAYMFNVYKNQQSRQTGSRNLSHRTTVIQDLLVRRQFSLVPPIGQTLMSRPAIGYYTSLFYLSMLSMFFIPPLPEGGGGYTVLPLYVCLSVNNNFC
jgi:hypothetical protein